jgi:hypothetical protein
MSARRKECCIERLKGVHGYRLVVLMLLCCYYVMLLLCGYYVVDIMLLNFILWEGTQFCLYGEMKIVVGKPYGWRVFGRTPV